MKNTIALLLISLVALAGSGCVEAGVAPEAELEAVTGRILLRNVRVLDVERGVMSEPQDVLIGGDRIVSVGDLEGAAQAARTIDCTGKYALPGLFDCHTHLAHLTDEGEEGVKAGLEALVAHGITQIRDVGGPVDVLQRMSQRIAAGELVGPEMFYAGPMLESTPLTWGEVNEELPGFTVALDTPEDVDRVLPELARQGAHLLKTFGEIDPEIYPHLVDVARRRSLRITHDPGKPLFHRVPMDVAIDLGITSFEHAKAPWPVVLTDDLRAKHDELVGPEASQMARMAFMMKVSGLGVESISRERLRSLARTMKEKGVHLCPTMQVFESMGEMAVEQVKEEQGLEEVPEAMREMIGKGLAAMEAVSRLFVAELAEQGVRLLVGQDGFEPKGTFAEMRWLRECGVPEAEILRGATLYPARWLGVDDRLGSIAPGKQANVLIVDGDPLEDITHAAATFLVIQDGRVVDR